MVNFLRKGKGVAILIFLIIIRKPLLQADGLFCSQNSNEESERKRMEM